MPKNAQLLFKNNNTKQGGTIALFIQNSDGEYDESSSDEFPKEGYWLNTEKSSCRNGGVLYQNLETKTIGVKVSNSDSCRLYFDKACFLTFEDGYSENNRTVLEMKCNTPLDDTGLVPNAPIREGYTFIGWYHNDSPVDFEDLILTGDMTITAGWAHSPTGGGGGSGGGGETVPDIEEIDPEL